MQNNIKTENNELQILLSDRLTFEDHETFREVIMAIKKTDAPSCYIDLANLKAIDSAGLGMLMIAFETSEQAKKKFRLKRPSGQVKRLLEISEFEKVMIIEN